MQLKSTTNMAIVEQIAAEYGGEPALYSDFLRFSVPHVATWDIDPVYPCLRAHYLSMGLDLLGDKAVWMTFLYLAVYKISSAEKLWELWPEPGVVNIRKAVPTGTERRNHRGATGRLEHHINHFAVVVARSGGPAEWLRRSLQDWDSCRHAFSTVWGNGPWATYKWADLMVNVHGVNLKATDIGATASNWSRHAPTKCLFRLTNGRFPQRQLATDSMLQKSIFQALNEAGGNWSGIDQFETSLCDFGSALAGRYYVGHDIDLLMEGLPEESAFWEHRKSAHPEAFLGELNGWHGVRSEYKSLYRDSGRVEFWHTT